MSTKKPTPPAELLSQKLAARPQTTRCVLVLVRMANGPATDWAIDKRETRDKIEEWMAIPLGDPREKALRAKEPVVDKLAENELSAKLDYAARFDSCDWEFPSGNWDILSGGTELQARQSWGLLLYWSLVMLPEPLIDYHAGYETEMNNICFGLPYLQDLEKKGLGKEQWDDLLARLLADLSKLHIDVPAAKIAEGHARAKQYLIGQGRKQAEVEAMPQSQVVLLFTVGLYQELSDEQYKVCLLHYGEAAAEYRRQEAKLGDDLRQEIIPLAAAGHVALVDLKRVETRIPFIMARLRIFEALRIYAAAHDGHLPQQLADIHEVPIPLNPYNDKPFDYSRDGDRALLSAENGRSDGPWRCEITMSSKAK
jgi:hypothetical protein